jgi:DNA-binding NarL/FixJ family response regulator
LAGIFAETARFKVVATGKCASDAVDAVSAAKPKVILIDLNMPGDAFDAIARIRALSPETKVIAFTASAGIDHAVRALDAGATGYVLKGSTDEELMQAVDTVVAGETFITPSFASKVISALHKGSVQKACAPAIKLSVREDQIVRHLLAGRTNKEIAQRLLISEKTVKHYMTVLMQKLQARNRVEVVLAAQELGGFVPERQLEPSAA